MAAPAGATRHALSTVNQVLVRLWTRHLGIAPPFGRSPPVVLPDGNPRGIAKSDRSRPVPWATAVGVQPSDRWQLRSEAFAVACRS
jgi:hypothetical protein